MTFPTNQAQNTKMTPEEFYAAHNVRYAETVEDGATIGRATLPSGGIVGLGFSLSNPYQERGLKILRKAIFDKVQELTQNKTIIKWQHTSASATPRKRRS